MKFGIPTLFAAALLASGVAALPLAGSASAQIMPQPDDSFDFGGNIPHNVTGMSFLIVSGISVVEGAEVTGVVMNGEDEISVTMINENETETDAVMVMAFTGDMDMMSVLSSEYMTSLMNDTSFGNSSIASTDDDDDNSGPGSGDDDNLGSSDDDGREIDDSGRDSPSDFDDLFIEDFGDDHMGFGNSMGPLGLFENLKNGSSVVPQGWESPQSVNVTLAGSATNATATGDPDTTFVFVMVVPQTEETAQTMGG